MFILFVSIIIIAIISLPIIIGVLIYRSTKNNKYKSVGLATLILPIAIVIYLAYSLITVFDPVYDKAEIKQNIGGTLICNSVYNSDLHSWQYDVSYTYKFGDDLLDIGSGSYYGREWQKNEQLIKVKNLIILKTGGWIGYDKILIINQITKKNSEYEFTPEKIESEDLWKKTKANSLINYCCSEAFIDKVENGQIKLKYKYRTSETLPDKYEVKNIYYNINKETGEPFMIKVQ